MSKAYEMIAESLNEIIQDLEENGGKNLKREIVTIKKDDEKIYKKKFYYKDEKIFEQTANI